MSLVSANFSRAYKITSQCAIECFRLLIANEMETYQKEHCNNVFERDCVKKSYPDISPQWLTEEEFLQ